MTLIEFIGTIATALIALLAGIKFFAAKWLDHFLTKREMSITTANNANLAIFKSGLSLTEKTRNAQLEKRMEAMDIVSKLQAMLREWDFTNQIHTQNPTPDTEKNRNDGYSKISAQTQLITIFHDANRIPYLEKYEERFRNVQKAIQSNFINALQDAQLAGGSFSIDLIEIFGACNDLKKAIYEDMLVIEGLATLHSD